MMQEYAHEFKEVTFRSPTELEKSGGVWPIRIGKNVAKFDYSLEPRTVPYYSLHFVLNGSVRLTHNQIPYTLHQGDVFCLFPQVWHHYSISKSNQKDPLRMFWIALDGAQVSRLLELNQITIQCPVSMHAFHSGLEPLLMELLDVYKKSLHSDHTDIRLLSLIYRILSSLTINGRNTSPTEDTSHIKHWVNKSKQFMDLHYAEMITITEIAQYAGVHRTQLHKQFVKQFGVSPIHYLQKLRLEKATALLWESTCSISDIAISSGYPDLSSFSRAYRKYYGRSPSEFRMNFDKVRTP